MVFLMDARSFEWQSTLKVICMNGLLYSNGTVGELADRARYVQQEDELHTVHAHRVR